MIPARQCSGRRLRGSSWCHRDFLCLLDSPDQTRVRPASSRFSDRPTVRRSGTVLIAEVGRGMAEVECANCGSGSQPRPQQMLAETTPNDHGRGAAQAQYVADCAGTGNAVRLGGIPPRVGRAARGRRRRLVHTAPSRYGTERAAFAQPCSVSRSLSVELTVLDCHGKCQTPRRRARVLDSNAASGLGAGGLRRLKESSESKEKCECSQPDQWDY